MTKSTKMMIASAAVAGLMTGAFPARVFANNPSPGVTANAGLQLGDDNMNDKHDCKGKNSCKGKGGCKTDKNDCKGQNSCKGKGGCATDGSKDK